MTNTESKQLAEIRIRGKNRIVPSATIEGRTVVVAKRWPRIASLKDEEFVDREAFENADAFMGGLKQSGIGADLFTFIQRFPDIEPKYGYRLEWENVAAIPVTTYQEWHDKQIDKDMQKALRKSFRRGVSVDQVEFNDDFVRGIVEIYNETPVRQQRRFWHYGKDFQTVKNETATYLDRSVFVGAYFEGKLIGFMKLVVVGTVLRSMQCISMASHMDKRPNNAIIAKAVEVCAMKGCSHLTYGKYSYGSGPSSLTSFKAHNGFKEYLLPRYYVPLTLSGRIVLNLGIHKSWKDLLPDPARRLLLSARAKYSSLLAARSAGSADGTGSPDGKAAPQGENAVSG